MLVINIIHSITLTSKNGTVLCLISETHLHLFVLLLCNGKCALQWVYPYCEVMIRESLCLKSLNRKAVTL